MDDEPRSAQSPQRATLVPRRFTPTDLGECLGFGWRRFRAIPGVSLTYSAPFALMGLALLVAVHRLGVSPMAPALAGGFMLLGPALLTGYLRLAPQACTAPRLRDAVVAMAGAPPGLWAVALLCALLFLVWMTDAAVLYAFIVGTGHLPFGPAWVTRMPEAVLAFELWASLLGAGLALILFAVSAFSVPLLHERRASLIPAVNASVRAVFRSFWTAALWGLLLATTTGLGILLLPLLPVVLPVLAYAGFALYRRVFPPPG